MKHGRLPQLEAELAEAESKQAARTLVKEEVSQEEIADIVSRWTGPVTRLIEGERQKLLHLESIMHERVIGQDEPVKLYPNQYTARANQGS